MLSPHELQPYVETAGLWDSLREIKTTLLFFLSHAEQAKDSALITILLPEDIQALWSHIYLRINSVAVIAEPPSSLSGGDVVCKMAVPFIALCPQRLSCRSHFLFTSRKKTNSSAEIAANPGSKVLSAGVGG